MLCWNVLKNRHADHCLALGIPLLVAAVLYIPFLKHGWWTGDDTALLNATIEHGWLPFFYRPEIWQKISATNLTPWVNLSYAIDWHLFGFSPRGFFIHHYLSLQIAILCCGLLFRETIKALPAAGALLLFVTSMPAMALAQHLWLRHYVEGLALASFAFFLFIKGKKTLNFRYVLAGALFYLLSVTAKEIYVPLVCLVILYPGSFSKKITVYKLPFVVVALFYVIWRSYMLGISNVFDPNIAAASGSLPRLDKVCYLASKGMFFNKHLAEFAIFCALAAALYLLFKKSRYFIFYLIVIVFATLMPVAPVASQLEHVAASNIDPLRILTLISLSFYTLLLYAVFELNQKIGLGVVVLILGINAFTITQQNAVANGLAKYGFYRKMTQFLLNGDRNMVLVQADGAPWFYTELLEIAKKTGLVSGDDSPRFCTDGCLCRQILGSNGTAFYCFDGADVVRKEVWRCNINSKARPYGRFKYSRGLLTWDFGPFQEGQYCALPMQKGLPAGIYCLPRKGKIKVHLDKDIQVILRYTSPSGWNAYSNAIEIKAGVDEN